MELDLELGLLAFRVSSFLEIILFIYLWLCWVFVAVWAFFLVALSSGYCLVVLHGLLIVMASLVAEDGLAGEGRGSFHSCDTWAR